MYSQKTDVYSFGILCWEIYHNGNDPYPGMTVAEVNKNVKDGYRMSLPDAIPQEIRLIILNCWEAPEKRWSANEIAKKFERAAGLKMPDVKAERDAAKLSVRRKSSKNTKDDQSVENPKKHNQSLSRSRSAL